MKNELIELQTQLAFQEQTINELNAVLTNQQQQIDILRLEFRQLQRILDEGDDDVNTSVGDEKPPHY